MSTLSCVFAAIGLIGFIGAFIVGIVAINRFILRFFCDGEIGMALFGLFMEMAIIGATVFQCIEEVVMK